MIDYHILGKRTCKDDDHFTRKWLQDYSEVSGLSDREKGLIFEQATLETLQEAIDGFDINLPLLIEDDPERLRASFFYPDIYQKGRYRPFLFDSKNVHTYIVDRGERAGKLFQQNRRWVLDEWTDPPHYSSKKDKFDKGRERDGNNAGKLWFEPVYELRSEHDQVTWFDGKRVRIPKKADVRRDFGDNWLEKLVCVGVGTLYEFTSEEPSNAITELDRFFHGNMAFTGHAWFDPVLARQASGLKACNDHSHENLLKQLRDILEKNDKP